jgi:hypothetical protein
MSEFLGLIDGVVLPLPGTNARLVWCDGQWAIEAQGFHGPLSRPADGVPAATTAKDARRIGEAWIAAFEETT